MATPRGNRRLLLVEDHSAFAQAIELVLVRSKTFDAVAVARTLSEGRELAERHPFGVTVVDLMLPDGDGIELVREIKRLRPEAPVLVLSAREDLSVARAAGADAVLSKAEPMMRIVMAIEGLTVR